MGQIKYKSEIVYSGPLAEYHFDSNWNDSMAEYYPLVRVCWLDNGDYKSKTIYLPQTAYFDFYTFGEIQYDLVMRDQLLLDRELEKKKKEEKRLDYHKLVKVVRGRKYPIGLEGEIFWMGQTKFGPSIGLRLIDDKRIFISPANVEVVTSDELFERDILGSETKK